MISKNKKLLKRVVTLSIPAMLEFSLQTLVNYVDYIMVGNLGVNATAAIGLTTEVSFLVKGGVNAVGIGVLAYVASSIGANKTNQVKSATVQAFYMSAAVGIITCLIAMAVSPFLPIWMGAEPEIRKSASVYFAIISSPLLFFSFNAVLGNVLKAAGDMKTPLAVNAIMNLSNIVMNYFLIYESRDITIFGREIHVYGAGLGVNGAGIATAAATVLGGMLMIVGVYRNRTVSPHGAGRKIEPAIIRECIVVGIPVMLTRLTSSGGRVLFTGLVARLGTIVYSAHTLAFTAESAFYIPCVGMMSAIATIAGNIKGEGDMKKLNSMTKIACLLSSGLMLIMAVGLYVLSDGIIGILTADSQVREIAPTLLKIVALNEPIFAVSMVLESIYEGTGNTKLPFVASTISQWTMRVGGSYICLYILGYGINVAWVCMILDNIFRCLLLAIAYFLKNKQLIVKPSCHMERAK